MCTQLKHDKCESDIIFQTKQSSYQRCYQEMCVFLCTRNEEWLSAMSFEVDEDTMNIVAQRLETILDSRKKSRCWKETLIDILSSIDDEFGGWDLHGRCIQYHCKKVSI